jgi:hypothetical protein
MARLMMVGLSEIRRVYDAVRGEFTVGEGKYFDVLRHGIGTH